MWAHRQGKKKKMDEAKEKTSPITISEECALRDIQKTRNRRSLMTEKYGFTLNERKKLKRLFPIPHDNNPDPNFVKAVLNDDEGQDMDEDNHYEEKESTIGELPKVFNEVRHGIGLIVRQTDRLRKQDF